MTKAELIEKLARSRDLPPDMTKKAIGQVLDLAFGELSSYFEKSKVTRSNTPRFTFPGFGTFTKKKRSARKGVNPRTLEPIEIEACYTLDFKPAVGLKRSMNQTKAASGTKKKSTKTKTSTKTSKTSKTAKGRKAKTKRGAKASPVTPRHRLITREEAELQAADAASGQNADVVLGDAPMGRVRTAGRGSGSKGRTG